MRLRAWMTGFIGLLCPDLPGADYSLAPQHFLQETQVRFGSETRAPTGPIQLLDVPRDGKVRVFASGKWYRNDGSVWTLDTDFSPSSEREFAFASAAGQRLQVDLPFGEVKQLLRFGPTNYLRTLKGCFSVSGGMLESLGWPADQQLNQLAISAQGRLYAASSAGLYRRDGPAWVRIEVVDPVGRAWAFRDVLGVACDSGDKLWFVTRAGVGCRTDNQWRFFEGKDGLPWNDFTSIATGPKGEVWFSTHLGVIRYDATEWYYRQGPLWLPNDNVQQVLVDSNGTAWFATQEGVGAIRRLPMTLAQKAEYYEQEIQRYVKRTEFGFVAEAPLRNASDKRTANPQDSDNDGLWTAMYGAGECFAYGATRDVEAKRRAKSAFEALRFLQKVTQGGPHSPPPGYIARTIRPSEWPDPNVGRLASDQEEQKRDRLWKAYEPRWPKSADGKWYWKSDTSSDELDGHYFFYPLYYDLCADTEEERERVKDVVRGITDHLLSHDFLLIDHDGRPTRWGVYGPQYLNRNPYWWLERGLKSLSLLSYLAVAEHVTGDTKYRDASRELIEKYGYAHNAMHPKVQHGPGSGNQSDDEMAVMCFYSLLRCSKDEELKGMMRYSFFRYWVNEAPELNPFFNFAYAACNLDAFGMSAWGKPSLKPWPGWEEDSMATLYGFPLDRLNWPHRNSHRLDVVGLSRVRASDLDEPEPRLRRGHRVNGKVLPVENRQFNHWNTDPWELDYGGNGGELAAGTVFLLPYYMGLYHGFIEHPQP